VKEKWSRTGRLLLLSMDGTTGSLCGITNSHFTPPDTTQLDDGVASCRAVWIGYESKNTGEFGENRK